MCFEIQRLISDLFPWSIDLEQENHHNQECFTSAFKQNTQATS